MYRQSPPLRDTTLLVLVSALGVLACESGYASIELDRADAAVASLSFDHGTHYQVALAGPGALVVGDVDEDGLVDLVYGFGSYLSVLHGDGEGGFPTRDDDDSLAGQDIMDVAVSNRLLVAVRREFDSVVLDYSTVVYTSDDTIRGIATVSNRFAVHLESAIALEDGTVVTFPDSVPFLGFTTADIDQDGRLDLVAGGPPGELYVVRQTDTGVDPPTTIPALNPITTAVVGGRFDADEYRDIAVLGVDRLRTLLRDRVVDTTDVGARIIGCGDVDDDGLDDIVAASDETTSVWVNNPQNPGSFLKAAVLDQNGTRAAVADFNGDARQDLAIVAADGIHIYLQR